MIIQIYIIKIHYTIKYITQYKNTDTILHIKNNLFFVYL